MLYIAMWLKQARKKQFDTGPANPKIRIALTEIPVSDGSMGRGRLPSRKRAIKIFLNVSGK